MKLVSRPKRLIGVITVKNNWAIQSFSYNRYLPIGRPLVLMQNLDRWGVDEILIKCIDRAYSGPHLDLLAEIEQVGITTPIIYGGGINSESDAVNAINAGADRVVIDAGWVACPEEVSKIYQSIGAQAVMASIPVGIKNRTILHYDYINRCEGSLPPALLAAIDSGTVSEVIVTDWCAEGTETHFNLDLLKYFPTNFPQLIAFGGLSNPDIAVRAIKHPNCVAVAIGNYLNYREHAVQSYKTTMKNHGVRQPQFYPFKTEQPIHAPDL